MDVYSLARSRRLAPVSEDAVLNANYLMRKLEPYYDLPYPQHCKHEFVLSGKRQKKQGVSTWISPSG